MTKHPVLIIGAGPAGLAAAIQLCRQGIQPLVLEKNRIGGLLLNANWVENYPGFVDGITGPDLVSLFEAQARNHGVEIDFEAVKTVEYLDNYFRIVTERRELAVLILVAGTGTKARQFPTSIIPKELRKQVYTEVYPLLEQKGKKILIIGAGDAAFDYGLNLARSNQITILNRGDKIKALPLLFQRAQNEPRIEYIENGALIAARETNQGKAAVSINIQGKERELEYDLILTAIGRDPDYDFASPSIMNNQEDLLKDKKLFLIGDLQNGAFRQTSIAVADGIRAAMEISNILEKGKA